MKRCHPGWSFLAVLACVGGLGASARAGNIYGGYLASAHACPPSGSTGSGCCNLHFNDAMDTATYYLGYSGLTSNCTSADVRLTAGDGCAVGAVIVHISAGGGTANILTGQVTWPAAAKSYLNCRDQLTVELDTESFQGGELRGVLDCFPDPVRVTTWGRLRQIYR